MGGLVSARRTPLAIVLLAIGLLVPLSAWLVTGLVEVRREQRALVAESSRSAANKASALGQRLADRLSALRDVESTRPYYHYQNLFHDPASADLGASIVRSPLAGAPIDPLVWTYFQIDARGRLTVPTFNDDVAELNVGDSAEEGRRTLAALRPAAPSLRAALGSSGVGEPATAAGSGVASQQQIESNQSYTQNVAANQLYNALKRKTGASGGALEGEVVITLGPLRFTIVAIDGAPRLIAIRSVQTPNGELLQGLVVSFDAIARWLPLPADAHLVASLESTSAQEGESMGAVPIALARGALRVVLDVVDGSELTRARAAIASNFFVRFLPVAALTCVVGLAVLGLLLSTERLARQRSQFAAAAAHELRTPLAGLQIYSEMLAGGLGDPTRSSTYAQRIADEAARLGRVVSNVLGFSQLERGVLTVQPRRGDLALAVVEEVEQLQPSLQALGAELTVDVPDDERGFDCDFDRDALVQVLRNLIDNAEKYSRNAADRTIIVSLRRAPEVRAEVSSVLLSVIDRGPGVAPSIARRLFRAFSRGDVEGAPAGIGLGLSLARALVRAHGGELAHRETDGGGATFVITLPIGG